ncbi:MAG: galactokinase [Candidatus Aureabacteria bacterium]|nr:galactokinase [Candidatus Auribacterota bacterium]
MIITRTPMRIPLGGGGTDLPSYYSRFGCKMVSAAIDKYMYIVVNRRVCDDMIKINYSRTEFVGDLSEIHHMLVREALGQLGIRGSIEISSIADAPAGTGMGSSSCFIVGLLNALHVLKGEHIPRHTLAEEACHIEIDILRKPIGKQDQYMAAFGGITVLEIDKSGKVTPRPAKISHEAIRELENNLLMFYTGINREALDILSDQKSATEKDEKIVVEKLHVIRDVGLEVLDALEKEDLKRFGTLLDVHWQAKRGLSGKVSSERIDAWYELAKKNGALGGKIMGAGGGGFFVFYCENKRSELRKILRSAGLREIPYKFDMDGSRILANF